ncbi:MAG: hypothetical protein U0T68_14400 [Ferruginibacter sp.]
MLPKGLTEILESVDYADYDFSFLNINLSTENLEVKFSINDTEGSNEKVIVLMTISGKTDFFIAKNDNSGYSHLEDKHPLLWQFSDIQCELYITGQTKTSKELAFDLFYIHQSLFGQYISYNTSILTTLNNGNGLLKKGSKQLLKIYADKINEYGIKTSIISEREPDKLSSNLKILFLGHSYFIGDNFEFEICK